MDFVALLQPRCLEADKSATEQEWLRSACPDLVRAGVEIGYAGSVVRRCTFQMLAASAFRIEAAARACREMVPSLPPSIHAVLVVGSSARGEAISTSDIDFNAYVNAEYKDTLRTSRNRKAGTARTLLMQLENELRKPLQEPLLRHLEDAGYRHGAANLSLKPFIDEDLLEFTGLQLALPLLLNILFAATPVWGSSQFERLLTEKLNDDVAVAGALMGRIALLRTRVDWIDVEARGDEARTARSRGLPDPLHDAHAVASCISAIVCAGFHREDPQIPYWCTFDAISARVDADTRIALQEFFAIVSLCRCGVMQLDLEHLALSLENALAVLSGALDSILDFLTDEGAGDETLSMWEAIADLIAEPDRARTLAERLGMPER